MVCGNRCLKQFDLWFVLYNSPACKAMHILGRLQTWQSSPTLSSQTVEVVTVNLEALEPFDKGIHGASDSYYMQKLEHKTQQPL